MVPGIVQVKLCCMIAVVWLWVVTGKEPPVEVVDPVMDVVVVYLPIVMR